jgi:ElaB/YqjD/DUF883 family membrane-anchored ribosome-binding protein
VANTTNRRRGVSQRRDNQQTRVENAGAGSRGIAEDAIQYLRDYVRKNPENAALWCLGIGFILGWKLKPW